MFRIARSFSTKVNKYTKQIAKLKMENAELKRENLCWLVDDEISRQYQGMTPRYTNGEMKKYRNKIIKLTSIIQKSNESNESN